jgi:hypothetical protein
MTIKKVKNPINWIMVLGYFMDYGSWLLHGNVCAVAKSTMFSSPWTCDALFWHPTFSGKNPLPQSFTCDNAWFLLLYLVAKALSAVIVVVATNVAAMTAIIATYLMFISGKWSGHFVYLR